MSAMLGNKITVSDAQTLMAERSRELKVGDLVRIRPDLEANTRYGGTLFKRDMLEYRNKIMTIDNIDTCGISVTWYHLKEAGVYLWRKEMFTDEIIGLDTGAIDNEDAVTMAIAMGGFTPRITIFEKENKTMNESKTKPILNLWKERTDSAIKGEYEEKRQAILDEDENVKAIIGFVNNINELIPEKVVANADSWRNKKILYAADVINMAGATIACDIISKETSKTLDDVRDACSAMSKRADLQYETIAALLSGCECYTMELDILKNWGIVDDKSRIIVGVSEEQ